MEGLLTEEMIKERKMEYTNEADKMMANSIEITETLPSPRIIKTHLPMDMLPPDLIDTCKVIFVCRNPKDCCVSYYHHYLNIPKYKFKGSFEDFANCFMDGTLELSNKFCFSPLNIYSTKKIKITKDLMILRIIYVYI